MQALNLNGQIQEFFSRILAQSDADQHTKNLVSFGARELELMLSGVTDGRISDDGLILIASRLAD